MSRRSPTHSPAHLTHPSPSHASPSTPSHVSHTSPSHSPASPTRSERLLRHTLLRDTSRRLRSPSPLPPSCHCPPVFGWDLHLSTDDDDDISFDDEEENAQGEDWMAGTFLFRTPLVPPVTRGVPRNRSFHGQAGGCVNVQRREEHVQCRSVHSSPRAKPVVLHDDEKASLYDSPRRTHRSRHSLPAVIPAPPRSASFSHFQQAPQHVQHHEAMSESPSQTHTHSSRSPRVKRHNDTLVPPHQAVLRSRLQHVLTGGMQEKERRDYERGRERQANQNDSDRQRSRSSSSCSPSPSRRLQVAAESAGGSPLSSASTSLSSYSASISPQSRSQGSGLSPNNPITRPSPASAALSNSGLQQHLALTSGDGMVAHLTLYQRPKSGSMLSLSEPPTSAPAAVATFTSAVSGGRLKRSNSYVVRPPSGTGTLFRNTIKTKPPHSVNSSPDLSSGSSSSSSPAPGQGTFDIHIASAHCRQIDGYVSFASVEGLGEPPVPPAEGEKGWMGGLTELAGRGIGGLGGGLGGLGGGLGNLGKGSVKLDGLVGRLRRTKPE